MDLNIPWALIGIVLYILVGFFVVGVFIDEDDGTNIFITIVVAWPFVLMCGLGMTVRKLLERLADRL